MTAKDGLREQIRAAFVENLGIKVLSVCCAVALYAFTHGPQDAQRVMSVSIVADMPPPTANRQLLNPLPAEVAVTLRGPRSVLDEINKDNISSLKLDLREARDATIDLQPRMFSVPQGVTIDSSIIPSSITVRWDDVITKGIPVQVSRSGEPAPGFAVQPGITVEPVEVQARGPRTLVDVMQFVRAAPFDVAGMAQGVHTVKLPLDKPPNLVSYNIDQVSASLQIDRQLVTKPFTRLKIEVIGPPRATTRPATVTVLLTGTAEEVNAIAPDTLVPRVEPKAAGNDTSKPGNDNLPVLLDLPKGVVAQIDPPKVVATW